MERLDAMACNRLSSQLQCPHSLFLSSEYTAAELTGVLRNLSALITSRYHASVLSLEQKIPIIAVSMDERLDAIMKELKLNHDYLHHVNDLHLSDKIYRSLNMAEEQREMLEHRMEIQLEYYYETVKEMSVFFKNYLSINMFHVLLWWLSW